jgi:CheY-like chemotaxis protein
MALILVIDDKTTMRELARRMLERGGHIVVEAEDGEAGLAMLERAEADIVITDLIMPKVEGIETIMRIKRSYPSTKIIAMSGGDEVNLRAARKLGADETLVKPFEKAVLLDMVNRLLGSEPLPLNCRGAVGISRSALTPEQIDIAWQQPNLVARGTSKRHPAHSVGVKQNQ